MPRTGTTARRGYGRPWERIRPYVLVRDGYICQICHRYGDTVDHIIPLHAGGDHALNNLRCLCRSCNSRLGAQYGNPLRQPASTWHRHRGTTTQALDNNAEIIRARVVPPSRNW